MRPRDPEGNEELEGPHAVQRIADDDDEAETDFVNVMVVMGSSPDRDFEVEVSVAESRSPAPWRTRSFNNGCWTSTRRTNFEQK